MTQTITDTLEEYGTDTPLPTSDRNERPTVVLEDWTHEGIRCALYRIRESHYCGYVQMPEGLVGEIRTRSNYDELDGFIEPDIEAHGGVTYGPDDDGWIGFDTAHAWDYNYDEDGNRLETIGSLPREPGEDDFEWDPEAVTEETEALAEQVAELAHDHGIDIEAEE